MLILDRMIITIPSRHIVIITDKIGKIYDIILKNKGGVAMKKTIFAMLTGILFVLTACSEETPLEKKKVANEKEETTVTSSQKEKDTKDYTFEEFLN